ncbi:hypothetical protein RKD41_003481 [Streptomyces tendae]
MSTHPAPALGALAPRLTELSLRDAQRLGRRLEGARKIRKPEARAAVLAEIEAEIAKGEERIAARRARVPAIGYPEQLPVSQKKDEIAAAIRDHQVVIVAGETGSGKTTQIPKICMELGRGVRGMIGHTPSPAGSPRARSPSGWRRNWTPRWARRSAGRCGSPTR